MYHILTVKIYIQGHFVEGQYYYKDIYWKPYLKHLSEYLENLLAYTLMEKI